LTCIIASGWFIILHSPGQSPPAKQIYQYRFLAGRLAQTNEFHHLKKEETMKDLIKMITEKAGIPEEKANIALKTVVGFLKDKMPAGIGSQVESFINKGTTNVPTGDLKEKVGDVKEKVSGMFVK